MSVFSNLTANLNLNIANFAANLNQASGMLSTFAATYNGALTGNIPGQPQRRGAFKDPWRIVQGILVSKVFYSAFQNITNATRAVYDFTTQLEQSHIAYKQFFGDTTLVNEFVNVLKDFAAITPFQFKEADQAAKQLLAYGFEYQNLMYVMQGVMNAAVAMGDTSKIPTIIAALGQIQNKGRVTGRELRRLAEANIPVFEILNEKLGITQEQFKNIAKEYIPAGEAINAIIDGINERYGALLYEMENTIKGLTERIKDNAIMVFHELFQPVALQYKAFLRRTADFMQEFRDIIDTQGIGGLFERLIPVELQSTFRTFFANLINIWTIAKNILESANRVLRGLVLGIVYIFNMIAPVVVTVGQIFAGLLQLITKNETAMRLLSAVLIGASIAWVIFRLRMMGAFIMAKIIALVNALTKALAFLGMMLTRHPVLLFFGLLAGVLVGVAVASRDADNALANLFRRLTTFQGVDPNKLLLPSQKERESDLEKFNNRLKETKEDMEGVEEATKKANKTLLSFDEVFRLTEQGIGDGLDEMPWDDEIMAFPGLDVGVPEIPDFEEFAAGYVMGLWEAIKDKLLAMGLGALIGALIGGLLGGPLGAAIGALIGGTIGYFWEEIMDYLGIEPPQQIAMGLAAAIGAIIGGLLGGPAGAAIGAAIGALMSGLSSMLWNKLADVFGLSQADANRASFVATLGGTIGAIIGGLLGGPVGAIIGAAIGTLAGGLTSLLWGILANKFRLEERDAARASLGTAIGMSIGAVIGGLLGGPVGAAIGATIGAFAGGLLGLFWEKIILFFQTPTGMAAGWGAALGGAIGLFFGPVGGLIGYAIGAALGAAIALIVQNWETITTFLTTNAEKLGRWLVDTFTLLHTKHQEFFAKIGQGVYTFVTSVYSWYVEWFHKIKNYLGTWAKDTASSIAYGWKILDDIVVKWLSDIDTKVVTFLKKAVQSAKTYSSNLGSSIAYGWRKLDEEVVKWLANVDTKMIAFFNTSLQAAKFYFNNFVTAAKNFASNMKTDIYDWALIADRNLDDFFKRTLQNAKVYFSDFIANSKNFASTMKNDIFDWAVILGSNAEAYFNKLITSSRNFASTMKNDIFDWALILGGNAKEFFNTNFDDFAKWLDSLRVKASNYFVETTTKWVEHYNALKGKATPWFNEKIAEYARFFNDIKTKASEYFVEATSKWIEHYNTLKGKATPWFNDKIAEYARFFNDIKTKASNYFMEAVAQWTEHYNTLKGKATPWFNEKIADYTNFFNNIRDKANQFFTETVSKWTEHYNILKDSATSWISGKITEYTTFFSMLRDKETNYFTEAAMLWDNYYSSLKEKTFNWFIGKIAEYVYFFNSLKESATLYFTETMVSWLEHYALLKQNASVFFSENFASFSIWLSGIRERTLLYFTEIAPKWVEHYNTLKQNASVFFSENAFAHLTWLTEIRERATQFIADVTSKWVTHYSDLTQKSSKFYSDILSGGLTFYGSLQNQAATFFSNLGPLITGFLATVQSKIESGLNVISSKLTSWFAQRQAAISSHLSRIISSIGTFFSNLWSSLSSWLNNIKSKVDSWWRNLWAGKTASVSVSGAVNAGSLSGRATGGIFDQEHIARFAEGNKAEAIIPLEHDRAMRPFVDAVATGLIEALGPMFAQMNTGGGGENLQPLYVGTLIADDRSLRELERKMQVIRLNEGVRRG